MSDKASADKAGKAVISYSSSNSKVLTVNKSGKITAKKPGTATVTVKIQLYYGKTQTYKTVVTVK